MSTVSAQFLKCEKFSENTVRLSGNVIIWLGLYRRKLTECREGGREVGVEEGGEGREGKWEIEEGEEGRKGREERGEWGRIEGREIEGGGKVFS